MPAFTVLKGAGGSGKSSTLRIVYQIIKQLQHTVVATFRVRTEICHVIKVGDLVIGLIGIGDTYRHVDDRLQWLLQFNCDFIICVSRPREVNWQRNRSRILELFGPNTYISVTNKVKATDPTRWAGENITSARILLTPLFNSLKMPMPPVPIK